MSFEQRKVVLESLRYVDEIVCQETKDYSDNLRRFRPDYMVHGTDWRTGPLAEVRQKAIDLIAQWGGEIVEPEYTQGVSSTQFKQKVKETQ